MHYKETKFGFEWGNAKIKRIANDEEKGWVVLGLETDRHKHGKKNASIQIYVTRTGKVRIYSNGEWTKPE